VPGYNWPSDFREVENVKVQQKDFRRTDGRTDRGDNHRQQTIRKAHLRFQFK
jgi:hypothetical protein